MRVGIGADHAGFDLKEILARTLAEGGIAVTDFGTHSDKPVDYPDYAAAVGRAHHQIARGDEEFAITYLPRGETVPAWQWQRVADVPENACQRRG